VPVQGTADSPYPMRLPFEEVVHLNCQAKSFSDSSSLFDKCSSRRCIQRHRRLLDAKLLVNLTVCYFNFIALDSPKGRPRCAQLSAPLSGTQREVVGRLLADASLFCRTDGGPVPSFDGGRKRLQSMLDGLCSSYSGGVSQSELLGMGTVAEDVDLDRIALPERAGVLNPVDVVLDPDRRFSKT
jgi:hypothetical protein